MNKSEQREIIKLVRYYKAGANTGMLARGLSALIRSSRTTKSQQALKEYAPLLGVQNHPDYIV